MALRLVEYDAVDLMTPRCGSSWRRDLYEHLGIRTEVVGGHHQPYVPEDHFAFTFIRHPVPWLESRFNSTGEDFYEEDPFSGMLQLTSTTLPDFLAAYRACSNIHGPLVQTFFEHWTENAHQVGRLETIHQDLWAILNGIGLEVSLYDLSSLPPVNVASTTRRQDWAQKDIDDVLEREKKTINRYYSLEQHKCLHPESVA